MKAFACLTLLVICSTSYAATPVYELPVIAAKPQAQTTTTNPLDSAVVIHGNQTIIHADAYQNAGIQSLAQLLQNTVGAQVQSGTSPNPVIYLRGKPALVLINGMPLANFSLQADDLNIMPFDAIDKIVVSQSSNGVEYGNQSTGGVINIITKQTGKAQSSVTLNTGYPRQLGGSAYLNKAWQDGWFTAATLSRQYQHGYRVHSTQNQGNSSFTLGKHYQTGTWQAQAWYARNDIEYAGRLTQDQLNNPTQSVESRQTDFLTNTAGINGQWQQQISSLWQLDVNTQYREQQGKANGASFAFYQDYQHVGLTPTLTGYIHTLDRDLTLKLGTQYTYDDYDDTCTPKNAHRNQIAGFTNLTIPLVPSWDVDVGYRFAYIGTKTDQSSLDKQSDYTTLNDISVKLTHHINTHWSAYLERLEGYQLPYIDQQTDTGQVVSGFALSPTTSSTYETGVNANYAEVQAHFSLFQTNDKNDIGYVCQPGSFICSNINLPKTRIRGVTASANWQITHQLTWQNAFNAWQREFTESGANNVTDGKDVPGAAPITWSSTVGIQLTPAWYWSVTSHYEYAYYPDGDYANAASKVPSYFTFSSSLHYLHRPWEVTLSGYNLTDKRYFDSTSYVAGTQTTYYYPADGRTVILSLRYLFTL